MLKAAHQLRYGIADPLPVRYALRAGSLSLEYQDGVFRYICCNEVPLLHSVYAAVRDPEWGTVPATISHVSVSALDDTFAVQFRSTHQRGPVHFVAFVNVSGGADGSIWWSFEGFALAEFDANRIGLCVLHTSAFSGRRCDVIHTDGSRKQLSFPPTIAPSTVFRNVRELHYPVSEDLDISIVLEGDIFETEDQRNWCDATYKTYSRPLHLPTPQHFLSHATVSQSLRLTLQGSSPRRLAPQAENPVRLSFEIKRRLSFPALGCALDSTSLSFLGLERLRALDLKFLLIDAVDLASVDAQRVSRELRVPLDVIVQPDHAMEHLEHLGKYDRSSLRRILVAGTSALALSAADQLSQRFAVPVAVGSRWNYAELNRGRPETVPPGGLWFAVQPQAHRTDLPTLIQNLTAQGEAVHDVADWSGCRDITTAVSFRAQLKTQHWSTEANHDPRLHSLLGAAWAVGSLKHLAEAGATNIAMFAVAGPSGLILDRAAARNSPLFEGAEHEAVSPAYHVLRALAGQPNAVCIYSQSSKPSVVEALAWNSDMGFSMMVANYTDDLQEIELLVPDVYEEGLVKILDEASIELAGSSPEEFARQPAERIQPRHGLYRMAVEPCCTYLICWPHNQTTEKLQKGRSQ